MPESLSLLILGASVRAAAQSALRAGLMPWGADLFGDADLPAGCRFERVGAYPDGFVEIAEAGPPGPWLYTGALENYPRLVEAISRHRPLWGNDAAALDAVRAPEHLFQILRAARLPCPTVCDRDNACKSGRWLLKPRAGSAGRGISCWQNGSAVQVGSYYLQEFIEGESCAALYVANMAGAELLGVTRQLVGQDWLHAKEFRYCGSIGPISPSADASCVGNNPVADAACVGPSLTFGTVETLEQIGNVLTAGCHLRGLFGVDFILRGGVPFPVEVNPRYTASVEVLELGMGITALEMHRQAFEPPRATGSAWGKNRGVVGKAILFARETLCFPEEGPWDGTPAADLWTPPAFADIPRRGTLIPRGKPILTLFAAGESVAECEMHLRQTACDLDRLLFGP